MTGGERSWRSALSLYAEPRVLALVGLGFSAGLPYLLVFSTLAAWLRDEGVPRTAIGFFGWVGITYSIKVLWAPVVDRVRVPLLGARLGDRRAWMLCAQAGIAGGLLAMAALDPVAGLAPVAACAVLIAFCSATQDIAVDAWRIEAAGTDLQAALAAGYILGYRVALLVAGAGALYVAEYVSWPAAYATMAALTGIGVFTVLVVREPARGAGPGPADLDAAIARHGALLAGLPARMQPAARWLIGAVVCPFTDFFARQGRRALLVLAFVGLYRLGDITMGIMANPFYLDLGFDKATIAEVTKVFGFFMTIAGSALGGLLVARYGLARPLLLGAALVAGTNLLFALLAVTGPDARLLIAVVSADNVSAGIATSVFVAYLSSLTNRAYTATQYALFSSLMTLPGKFLSGFSGAVVDGIGYPAFFVYAAATGVPALVLTVLLVRDDARGRRLVIRDS